MRQGKYGKVVPIGIMEQARCYRVRKKIKGKYVHVCNTKNYVAGLVAFDLFTTGKGLEGDMVASLNFPGVSKCILLQLLNKLDKKAYSRVVYLINE